MFFGSVSAVFESFLDRFQLVSDRFGTVLHDSHTVFFVLLASSLSRRRFRRRRRLRCRRGDPTPNPRRCRRRRLAVFTDRLIDR